MATRIYRTTVNGKTTTRTVVSRSAWADDWANTGAFFVKGMLAILFVLWPFFIPVPILNVVLGAIWSPIAAGGLLFAAYPQLGEWLDKKSGTSTKPAAPQSPKRPK